MAYLDDGKPADTSKMKPGMVKDSGIPNTSQFTGEGVPPPVNQARAALSGFADKAGAVIDKGLDAVGGYVARDRAVNRAATGTGPPLPTPQAPVPMQKLATTDFNNPESMRPKVASSPARPSDPLMANPAIQNLIGPATAAPYGNGPVVAPNRMNPQVNSTPTAVVPTTSAARNLQGPAQSQAVQDATSRFNAPTGSAPANARGYDPSSVAFAQQQEKSRAAAPEAPKLLTLEERKQQGIGWKTANAMYKEQMDAYRSEKTSDAALARERLSQNAATGRTGMQETGSMGRAKLQEVGATNRTEMQQTGETQRQGQLQQFTNEQGNKKFVRDGEMAANNLRGEYVRSGGDPSSTGHIQAYEGRVTTDGLTPVPLPKNNETFQTNVVPTEAGGSELWVTSNQTGKAQRAVAPGAQPLATGTPAPVMVAPAVNGSAGGASAIGAGGQSQNQVLSAADHQNIMVMRGLITPDQQAAYIAGLDEVTQNELKNAK